MIIGFLIEDRAALLACALAGNSFYSPSRAHLFVEIEVNSLQRFRGLLELSLKTLGPESLKPFPSVRRISVLDADTWVTPETLPNLLFLPLLAPFPNIREFRIDNLTLTGCTGAETLPIASTPSDIGSCVGIGIEVGAFRGVPTDGSPSDSWDFPTAQLLSTARVEALILGNCRVPSLGWFLRYISHFPDLKSISLIDFTWGSVGGEDANRCPPAFQCPQRVPKPPKRLSELTLKNQSIPLATCAPNLLFDSLSGSVRTLRLMHIEMFLCVDINEGSIYLDPSYITLSPLNSLTHLTLPPVAVWLQAKQRWLPDLLSTITSTPNLRELHIHLLFSPIAIKAQLDAVVWSAVDLIMGHRSGEELECGMKNGVRTGGRGSNGGCVFMNLEVVKITSAGFNPERPPLDGEARLRIREWLTGYMPRMRERGVLQIPLSD